MNSSTGVWTNQSSQWDRVGPPLRPCLEDHQLMERGIHEVASKKKRLRALVMGVTPEMARLKWPDETDLLAVDKSQHMIDSVWPGYPNPGEGVLCGNWLDLPLEKHSRDLAVSDGPFGVLRFPHEYYDVLKQLKRVLTTDGIFVFRIFARPEKEEKASEIYEAALNGNIGNFHVFKLRLLMAMQPDSRAGVRTGDVWEEWEHNGPGSKTLSDKCGWPVEQINTIEAYRGQNDIYSFPTLQEILAILDESGFEILRCTEPAYELGERCPTLTCKV
ncbi:class I SAM-dependent methyltransferase [Rhodohalobacter sp. 614A]|uniref:class I SAM-dependent methyltransferase n=1 Tax=Rhodohalobacter sp. 614A TaxID=2908649 RepID=UPI001F2F27C6|nr:methyltransferase domain-containing protein [Rhodohalobacter sp. 614A]